MAPPTNQVIVRAEFTLRVHKHFGNFCNIFLPNIGEDQKKSHHLSAGLLAGTMPYYGKSGPGYCITFIKRLDESLRY